MSLDPRVLAFLGRPPATPSPLARPVRGYAGKACEQPNQHTQETDMPRGGYERKPATEKSATATPESAAEKPRRKKASRRAKPRKAPRRAPRLVMEHAAGPRFGVFEDGSVEVRLPDCRGTISGDDAAALHAFITKLRG